MKAAVITAANTTPVFGEFAEPRADAEDVELITVSAAALSQFSKSRSTGAHYSAAGIFPSVAGADGVGRTTDGQRVYFALPQAPFGALAERTLVRRRQCVPVPEGLDDATAAAIANPGMSAWAALVERAQLKPGETVLVNGATGTAGAIAVQIAKYLGAGRVIATGRNEAELQALRNAGADVVIAFALNDPRGTEAYEHALEEMMVAGIDVVVDYLWGESAIAVMTAIAKTVEDATPVRFVHVGAASSQNTIALPGAALRSSAMQLMGSGIKSVPLPRLLECIWKVFEAAGPAGLRIATKSVPLSEIGEAWTAPNKPRVVIEI